MKPATILIVDDEADFTNLLQELLASNSYQCLKALSGKKAIEIFEKNKDIIDIILLDWKMPYMNGDETLIRLKEIKPDVFVVMISAFGDQANMTRSVNLGARGYIHKPISDDGTELLSKIRDLLELRRLAELEVQAMRDMLQVREQLAKMGELAGKIAHYMKNAIWNISGRVQLIMENEIISKEKSILESLETINRIADETSRVLYSVLHYARKLPDKAELKETSLLTILQDIFLLLEPERKRKNISISCAEKDIEGVIVLADKLQLGTAFLNICQNAIEAVDYDGIIKVDFLRSAEGDRISILISDDGPGMDENTKGRLFEPFFTTKPDGVGLGLRVSYDIINNHRGMIEVVSELGKGTTFKVTLNVAKIIGGEDGTDSRAS